MHGLSFPLIAAETFHVIPPPPKIATCRAAALLTGARTRKSNSLNFSPANAFYSVLYLRFYTQRSSVRARASLHDFKGKTLGGGTRSAPVDGEEFDFAQLKGKVVLINNVATM